MKNRTSFALRPGSVAALALSSLVLFASPAAAQEVVNIYSSRHYDTDERLYSDFTALTGIEVNRIEGKADGLITRLETEGENSPADLLITVDAGRMWRAEQAGVLQAVQSDVLDAAIPEHLRHPEGVWYGFSQRARIIFYAKDRVSEPPKTYEALADPKYKGQVCTRSGSNIYMLSLMAAIIDHHGEEVATEWAKGMWDNRSRDPQGGDTDQLRAIVSGECDIVVSNTYYYARGLGGGVDGLSGSTDMIGWVFPNQSTYGTHVNISAAAVTAHAPNKENAIAFLEYLSTPQAQQYFSDGNNEYPAVPGVELGPNVAALGLFRQDTLSLDVLGENQAAAQAIYDSVGYQ
ncbi:MAG: Fe(3+) ABC transporter substrate-binding protein [Pseudomonadota bacterium]